ncbi:MAG: type II toxin-antitoxin system VapB family antitoxin [Nocardioidaceae bacterium]
MSLTIKNERVLRLAREAARQLGTSRTAAIEHALTRLLANLDARERALAIADDFERRLSPKDRARMVTGHLYDDRGLPTRLTTPLRCWQRSSPRS